MTSRDFCYWLQGFFEITNAGKVDTAAPALENTQVDMIQRHLALVFVHEIDPSAGPPAHQAVLNEVHSPPQPTDASKPHPRPQGPFGPVYRC